MVKKIALGELCNSSQGHVKEKPDTLIDYIDISSVDNESKSITGFQTMSFSEAPSRARKDIKKNNILVSTVRPNLNAVAVYEEETPNRTVVSTGFCVLDCKTNVDYRFVFNFCRSQAFIDDMVSQATGASYPAVSDKIVRSSMVPAYSYEEQCKISDVLDTVSKVIADRKQELEKLDELIKARFVELFGDDAKYKKEPLIDNVQEMFIGPFGSALKNEYFVDEADSYCMVYEQKHAIQKTMNLPTRYVDEAKYNELKRFTVIGGDIIVSCRGTIGEIYSVPDDAPMGIMHPSIMKIRLKKEKYCNLFFVLMLDQYMQENIAKANGSGIKMAVTATDLGKELFVVPAIEEQRNFENFVLQVDKSKVAVQKALDEAQLLFDSLMQKYFG